VVVSCDLEFDEETTWNWDAQEEKPYNFLPYLGEEGKDQEISIQDALLLIHSLHQLHLMPIKMVQVKGHRRHEIYVKSMKGLMKLIVILKNCIAFKYIVGFCILRKM